MGLSDVAGSKSVKLYCAKCEDIFNPKSSQHAAIDGAYFGSSFHNILFQVYPTLVPEKSQQRYEPRIYGFRVHASAALARWQGRKRDEMKVRLRQEKVNSGFVEDSDYDEGPGIGDVDNRGKKLAREGKAVVADSASARMDLGM
jgi:casein kinase II subunit beta